ncbi:MAG: hypothetical protein KF773_30950 [Deltaproteobacteria bacterium]|nr:hypothetical protein [Deltaproteobacteria bacterium]MCW5803613.1 hypothetical protein [Deltaproteobacteria bacterium]
MSFELEIDRARSTEYLGLGQSGYTAGRVEGDPSLNIIAINLPFPHKDEEHPPELGVDERFG